jgi:5-methylcytosine-specific restriction endonuclease McrA
VSGALSYGPVPAWGCRSLRAPSSAVSPPSGATNSREFDHIFPFSRGGGRDVDNIWDLCRTCNRQKGAQTLDEWNGYP